jgi:hypothetical protein
MRMRPHVDAAGSAKHGRSGMVEEDERPHQARLRRGQRAMHAEITKINRARHDYLLDQPTAGIPRYPNNVRGADLTFLPCISHAPVLSDSLEHLHVTPQRLRWVLEPRIEGGQ